MHALLFAHVGVAILVYIEHKPASHPHITLKQRVSYT